MVRPLAIVWTAHISVTLPDSRRTAAQGLDAPANTARQTLGASPSATPRHERPSLVMARLLTRSGKTRWPGRRRPTRNCHRSGPDTTRTCDARGRDTVHTLALPTVMSAPDAWKWPNNLDTKHFGRFAGTWMGVQSSGKVRWCGLHGVVLPEKGGIGQPKCRITCFVCRSGGGFFASACAGRCQTSREVVAFSLFSSCAAFLAGFDLLRRLGARRSVPGSRGRWRGSCIAGRMMARRRWGMAGGWGFAAFRSWT